MNHIIGVILLIFNGLFLCLTIRSFKEALNDAKKSNCKNKLFITIICFLGDAWEIIALDFLTLMLGLICLQ